MRVTLTSGFPVDPVCDLVLLSNNVLTSAFNLFRPVAENQVMLHSVRQNMYINLRQA